MGLTWWAVPIIGSAALVVTVAPAVLLPMDRPAGLGPLANTSRLTRLPEYRAAVRRHTRATVTALALLILMFGTTVLASARPTGTFWDSDDSTSRDDIMLCTAEPVTSRATGEFLTYFARQATTYGTERIGLTSANRRVVPLTRDYQLAAGRFGDYAQASRAQAEADAGTLAPAETLALRVRTDSYSPPVGYEDYSPTVADVLALCLTGFPGSATEEDTRRSLILSGSGRAAVLGRRQAVTVHRCAGDRHGTAGRRADRRGCHAGSRDRGTDHGDRDDRRAVLPIRQRENRREPRRDPCHRVSGADR